MIDLVKKTLLTGVGLAAMTKDKVEEVARELARTANLSSEKGQALVDEAVARAEQARQELDATVQRMVNAAIKKTNLVTQADLAQLAARVEKLEQTQAGNN